MRAYIAVTDDEWYDFLNSRPELDEVNFWRPGGQTSFRAIKTGELFLFKLHAPRNYIVGGGVFAHYSRLPVSLAWEAFLEKNGAPDLQELRRRIGRHRSGGSASAEDYQIGCILLEQPFFLPRGQWIPAPTDLTLYGPGKTYDLNSEAGRELVERLRETLASRLERQPWSAEDTPLRGQPLLVFPRLGQGIFRIMVTDAYQRRCAITREKVLPVLEAAHIKPVSEGGHHRIENGLLLRADVHALFDRGYVTVTPDYRFLVSHRLKREFDNGEQYLALQGRQIWLPPSMRDRPGREMLEWHADTLFRR